VETSVVWNPEIAQMFQTITLQRVFRDALYPKLLFRMEQEQPGMLSYWPIIDAA
jgi:hypothetical protein